MNETGVKHLASICVVWVYVDGVPRFRLDYKHWEAMSCDVRGNRTTNPPALDELVSNFKKMNFPPLLIASAFFAFCRYHVKEHE